MKQNNLKIRLKEIGGKKNFPQLVRDGLKLLTEYGYYKTFKSARKFVFNGKKLSYLYYPYNATWRNERSIEIPIALNYAKDYAPDKVLELGNVLSHYTSIEHDVLDKYEKAPGVINEDAVDFKTDKKYDLIISVSTIEHIGWDEEVKEPLKVLKAIKNLKKYLNKDGKIISTFSIGYNPNIDNLLKEGKLFDKIFYMKRVSKDNFWKQVNGDGLDNVKFGSPFPFGNLVVIGITNK